MPREYSVISKRFDLALLELETPVSFTKELCKSINPACLYSPPENGITEEKNLTVIGFGINSSGEIALI